ncbi:Short-chain dehydrogenase [Oryzisolibacter propanilivorax]|uniref:Short-chain dehydrogenase n=1 Tax=Oryzisolibacter propanilivorax TaxID=1527607 RepID=A0A1G9QN38_9BURK|nr:SDR family oxidoreductase [Oryzisolibacter propanilivorax]SDM12442.1 Short-chain dehydrogenase [Oryzisolibacter propanilivorax]
MRATPDGRQRPLAFITGASSGIGQALAMHYLRAGWRLALVARRAEVIETWLSREDIPASSYEIHSCDVSLPDAVIAAAEACLQRQGLPDVVIANAGISIGMDSAERADLEVMARIFATNNLGLAATFHPFIAPMRARGSGRLVGIASVAGVRGLPGHGAYCASKAAVIAYCESLRGELRGSGVRVVTLSPGYVDTPLTRQNRYAMPFLLDVDAFAARAAHAIARGDRHRVIPWQMGLVAGLLRVLPGALFDRLLAGRARKHRQGQGRGDAA